MTPPIKGTSALVMSIHDIEQVKQRGKARRNSSSMQRKLFEQSREDGSDSVEEMPMKRLKVYCNYARDQAVMLGGGKLILTFNGDGYATMPAILLPLLEAEMRVKPGRYRLVEEPAPAPIVVDPLDQPSKVVDIVKIPSDVPVPEPSELHSQIADMLAKMRNDVEEAEEVAPRTEEEQADFDVSVAALSDELEEELKLMEEE